jgi:pyruvate,water dikinase
MTRSDCIFCSPRIAEFPHVALRGRPAFHACVIGIVRIVFRPEDLNQITEGDILVTGQTSPNAVPAIRRAGGVITERGGILCHAAIVCRELSKPCIVGAAGASHKLRNGQRVLLAACTGDICRPDEA